MAGFGNWARSTHTSQELRGNIAITTTTTSDGHLAEQTWEHYDGPSYRPDSHVVATQRVLFDSAGNQRQVTEANPHVDLTREGAVTTHDWHDRVLDSRGREVSSLTWDDRNPVAHEVAHRYDSDGGVWTRSATVAHHDHGDSYFPPGTPLSGFRGVISTPSWSQEYQGPDGYHIQSHTDGGTRTVQIDSADGSSHRTVLVDVRTDQVSYAEVTTVQPDHTRVTDTFHTDGSGERIVTSPKDAVTAHITYDAQGHAQDSHTGEGANLIDRQAVFESVQSEESKGYEPHLQAPVDPYNNADPLQHMNGSEWASGDVNYSSPEPIIAGFPNQLSNTSAPPLREDDWGSEFASSETDAKPQAENQGETVSQDDGSEYA